MADKKGFTIISNFPTTAEGAFVSDDKHMEVSLNGKADDVMNGIATMAAASITDLIETIKDKEGLSEKEATDKAIEAFVKRLSKKMSELKLKKMCDELGITGDKLPEAVKGFIEAMKDLMGEEDSEE